MIFSPLRFFAHHSYGVRGAGDGSDGGGVAGFSSVFEADVFGVMEVLGKLLGYGLEFIFDHYVDVVAVEAFVHEPGVDLA